MKHTLLKLTSILLCLAIILSSASCKSQNTEPLQTTLPTAEASVTTTQDSELSKTTSATQTSETTETTATSATEIADTTSVTTQSTSASTYTTVTDNEASVTTKHETEENVLDVDCIHTDSDENLYCDNCKGYLIVELDIFAINDIHGKFTDSDTQPGVDELTTYLESQDGNVILLSSGDTWQGSSESNLTYGKLMIEWMNRLDFAAMTLGNHEFDWGTEYIYENADYAEFPFLAINVYETATKQRAEYCQPSVMVEQGGIKIGIIGAIGDCYNSIAAEKVQDVYFVTGSQLTSLVKAEAQRLREQGADIIVYSIHDGHDRNGASGTVSSYQLSPYYDTALSNGYVDMVFEAHTHKNYVFKDEHGVYHLQGGGENKGIIKAEFTYNALTDQIAEASAQYIQNNTYSSYDDSPIIAQILEKFESEISKGYDQLGFNGKKRNDKELREISAKLYYQAGVERWGKDYKIVLGGGSFSIRNPYNLAVGTVLYSHLQSLMPFDNTIVLCSIKGSDLTRRFIENNDDRYAIYFGEYGNSVKDNIDPNGTYYIITDTWSSDYAPNRLTTIARYDEGVYVRDLFATYVASGALDDGLKQDGYTLTSIPDAVNVGKNLAAGAESRESYYVQGKVISIDNTTYGNMTIADEQGNSIYIYGLYDLEGKRFDVMSKQPKIGDTIVVYGTIKHYSPYTGNAIIEFMNATLIK